MKEIKILEETPKHITKYTFNKQQGNKKSKLTRQSPQGVKNHTDEQKTDRCFCALPCPRKRDRTD